jgi:hypothetical protein
MLFTSFLKGGVWKPTYHVDIVFGPYGYSERD